MVELHTQQIDTVFHALSDATRRRMLWELTQGERTVGQLAEPHAMSLAAASKHIKVLEGAGLVRREIQGRTHLCRLDPGPLATAHEWLSFYEHFWTDRLDALERLLKEDDARKAGAERVTVKHTVKPASKPSSGPATKPVPKPASKPGNEP